MKEKKGLNVLLYVILIGIMIVGAIVIALKGFSIGMVYRENKRIDMYVGREFELSEITEITDEVFPDQEIMLRKIELFEDSVAIYVKEVSEEQLTNLMNRFNEKFELDYTLEEITIIDIPEEGIWDMIKPYLVPVFIGGIVTILYMMIRYHKLGIGKVLLYIVITVLVAELLFISVMAITRIEVNRLTVPAGLLVYIGVVTALAIQFENEMKTIKPEKAPKNK